jgi:hypothetical protein
VDCFFKVLLGRLFVACTANVFDGIAKVEVKALVTDKVPDLD